MHRSEIRNDVGGMGAVALGAVALVFMVKACTGCSPAAQTRVVYTIEEGSHAEESNACVFKAKADSGTFAEFCECWTDVQKKHHVDAGDCKR